MVSYPACRAAYPVLNQVLRYYVNALQNPPIPSWRHPTDEFPQGSYHQQNQLGSHGDQYYGNMYPSGGGHGGHDNHDKKKSGGLGTGAAVGLGVGAGVVGGLIIADQIQDAQEEAYEAGRYSFALKDYLLRYHVYRIRV